MSHHPYNDPHLLSPVNASSLPLLASSLQHRRLLSNFPLLTKRSASCFVSSLLPRVFLFHTVTYSCPRSFCRTHLPAFLSRRNISPLSSSTTVTMSSPITPASYQQLQQRARFSRHRMGCITNVRLPNDGISRSTNPMFLVSSAVAYPSSTHWSLPGRLRPVPSYPCLSFRPVPPNSYLRLTCGQNPLWATLHFCAYSCIIVTSISPPYP